MAGLRPFRGRLLVFLFLIGAALVRADSGAEVRTWTEADGRTLEARFDGFDGEDGIWLILGDGRRVRVEVARLREGDRSYLEKQRPKPEPGEIVPYSVRDPHPEEAAFLEEHGIAQLSWRNPGAMERESGGRNPEKILPFLLFTPDEAREEAPGKLGEKFPLIVQLCGTGGFGANNLGPLFRDAGGSARALVTGRLQDTNPCHVLYPQPTSRGAWHTAHPTDPSPDLRKVVHVVRHLCADPTRRVDPDRVYVMGLSLGGAGAFQAVLKRPDVFAAAIPIAHVHPMANFTAENSRDNLWLVVNKGDRATPPQRVEDLRQHLRGLGARLRLTVHDAGGHDAWSRVFEDQKFRTWLFARRRGED